MSEPYAEMCSKFVIWNNIHIIVAPTETFSDAGI
jgi:hypothetical protein